MSLYDAQLRNKNKTSDLRRLLAHSFESLSELVPTNYLRTFGWNQAGKD